MNDLPWIKYHPWLMFCDTADMTAEGERAHRRLMDWLWGKDQAPVHDDEILRQITHTEPGKWGRTKAELLGHGWAIAGKWFLHRRAIESLNEAKAVHLANYNRTAPANGLPLIDPTYEPETGIMRYEARNVARNDIRDDGRNEQRQPPPDVGHSNSNSNSNIKKEEGGKTASPSLPLREVFDGWNEMASRSGLPQCLTLSDSRRRKLGARLNDPFFKTNWQEALRRVPKCPFLKGDNNRGWRASFDWFMQPDAIAKIMEGFYKTEPTGKSPRDRQIEERLAEV